MTFKEAIESGFQNYANFVGRTPRSGYWWWALFGVICNAVAQVLDMAIGAPILQALVGIGLFLPGLSVSARRLHDVDKSGWNILWILTIIGILYVLYLYIQPGTDGPNRYGAPLTSSSSSETFA